MRIPRKAFNWAQRNGDFMIEFTLDENGRTPIFTIHAVYENLTETEKGKVLLQFLDFFNSEFLRVEKFKKMGIE